MNTNELPVAVKALSELAEKLSKIPKVDRGLSYTNGRVSGRFDTELSVYGELARSMYWIIENAEVILSAILPTPDREAGREPVAHIVTDPKGKMRVTLATVYDPMASAFWVDGEMPGGYSVTPLFLAPPSVPVGDKEEIAHEARFLLDRLSDLEWSDIPEDFWRDWNGHVEPSIARLRAALTKMEG